MEGVKLMDKIFNYDTYEMLRKLEEVEDEMREDSYHDCESETDNTAYYARYYIKAVYEYMRENYCAEECTVLRMIKEMYRIAETGEYSYLQTLDDIGFKNQVFERMTGAIGRRELLYAVRLLRYYYLVKEKKDHPKRIWNHMENMYEKVLGMGPLKKMEKKEKFSVRKKELTEEEFIPALRRHMDKNMVGQDVLKKKLCITLYQWKYHDVRSTLLMVGPSGSGKNHMIETIRSFPYLGFPVVSYDCSSLTPNGFNGADVRDVFKRVRQVCMRTSGANPLNGTGDNGKCIVFLDEIDKIINFNHDSHGESVNAMVQQQLLSSLAGTENIEGVDTSKILFILGGAFPRIDDLKKDKGKNPIGFNSGSELCVDLKDSLRDQIIAIGGEVEFVGRIEDIVQMSRLTKDDLRAILMDENIGIFTEKKKLYQESGLNLEIEEDTIEAIVDLIEKEDAGARSARNILNQFADSQYFYDMKVGGYNTMKIHKGMLNGEAPIFIRGGADSEKIIKYS
ncbi:MAG TPA: AAA family ATPase [Candidatus Mediterraneibacter excrementigallinarum]|nr:AAA family ATPase [Candidatus Mediterraneibacter excrementigallinarum]